MKPVPIVDANWFSDTLGGSVSGYAIGTKTRTPKANKASLPSDWEAPVNYLCWSGFLWASFCDIKVILVIGR